MRPQPLQASLRDLAWAKRKVRQLIAKLTRELRAGDCRGRPE